MKISVAALLLLFACSSAIACSCGDLTLAEAREVSDVVFVGQVTLLKPSSIPGKTQINFSVSESFKGRVTPATFVLIESDSSSCGYVKPFFHPGSKYLIFATQEGSRLETSRCLPNKRGKPSVEESRKLRARSKKFVHAVPLRGSA